MNKPLQKLPCASRVMPLRSGSKKFRSMLTAVSSMVRSSGSAFPPGRDVSPAYDLKFVDRLTQFGRETCLRVMLFNIAKALTDSTEHIGHPFDQQTMQQGPQHSFLLEMVYLSLDAGRLSGYVDT